METLSGLGKVYR